MKCQKCNQTVEAWHSYCPYCQVLIQSVTYSTITNLPTESLEEHSRRKLIRTLLQFALLAVAVIALASVIRLNPTKATTVAKKETGPNPSPSATANDITENLAMTQQPATAATTIAPPLAPENTNNATAIATKIAKAEPASLLPDELIQRSQLKADPLLRTSARTEPLTAEKIKPAPAFTRGESTKTDEALPKKLATLMKTTSAPPPATPKSAEVEPRLDIESTAVNLNPDTGLVTIKSYTPARVYIDGVFSGITPRSVKILAGDHVITLLADGYQEYTRKIKINGLQQMGILASMSKK